MEGGDDPVRVAFWLDSGRKQMGCNYNLALSFPLRFECLVLVIEFCERVYESRGEGMDFLCKFMGRH